MHVWMSVCLPRDRLSVCLWLFVILLVFAWLFVCLSVCLCGCLSDSPSLCVSLWLSVWLSICLTVCLSTSCSVSRSFSLKCLCVPHTPLHMHSTHIYNPKRLNGLMVLWKTERRVSFCAVNSKCISPLYTSERQSDIYRSVYCPVRISCSFMVRWFCRRFGQPTRVRIH